jgi:hypothetical protein
MSFPSLPAAHFYPYFLSPHPIVFFSYLVLSDVFLLGDFNIFEPLKASEGDWCEGESLDSSRGSYISSSHGVSAMCDSLNSHIEQRIDQGATLSLRLGLIHASTTSTAPMSQPKPVSSTVRTSGVSISSNTVAGVFPVSLAQHVASTINIELHYNKFLSAVFTAKSLAAYNVILRFLLQLATNRWAIGSTWMQYMRSNMLFVGRAGNRRRKNDDDRNNEETLTEDNSGRMLEDHLTRTRCRAGIGLVIHTLSVLQSHYMGLIHGHIMPLYTGSTSSISLSHRESRGSSDLDIHTAEKCVCLLDLCSSIPQLKGQHEGMLEAIGNIISPCQHEVLQVLSTALAAVSEMRNALKKEKVILALDIAGKAKIKEERCMEDEKQNIWMLQEEEDMLRKNLERADTAFEKFRAVVTALTDKLSEVS